VHFKTPVRESEAKEHRAEMKKTKVGYRYLHAHTAPIAPGFENALLGPSKAAQHLFEGLRPDLHDPGEGIVELADGEEYAAD
jgi:hypothetical protein